MRTVISLGPAGVSGMSIIPGGQNGNPTSEFFDDQAARWLANEASPVRFTPEQVADGAVGRERFAPM